MGSLRRTSLCRLMHRCVLAHAASSTCLAIWTRRAPMLQLPHCAMTQPTTLSCLATTRSSPSSRSSRPRASLCMTCWPCTSHMHTCQAMCIDF